MTMHWATEIIGADGRLTPDCSHMQMSLTCVFLFLQYWYDYKLQWEPSEYGGVNMLHVPSDHIWRPDISLYNK